MDLIVRSSEHNYKDFDNRIKHLIINIYQNPKSVADLFG